MEIRCPKCEQVIDPRDINREANFFVCGKCDEAYRISEVVETPAGLHVLKLEERRASRRLTLPEARQGLVAILVEEQRAARVKDLVRQLRAKARIEIHL